MSDFIRVDERTWKVERADYTGVVTRNGHCGYWMVLTDREGGKKSGRLYGKHFKALASWFPIWESRSQHVELVAAQSEVAQSESTQNETAQPETAQPETAQVEMTQVETEDAQLAAEDIEYSNFCGSSKSQAQLESECPDFHNLPSEWLDFIETHMEQWEKAA